MEGTNCPLTLAVIFDKNCIKNKAGTTMQHWKHVHSAKHLMNTTISWTCHNHPNNRPNTPFLRMGRGSSGRDNNLLKLLWFPEATSLTTDKALWNVPSSGTSITLALDPSLPDPYFLCGPRCALPAIYVIYMSVSPTGICSLKEKTRSASSPGQSTHCTRDGQSRVCAIHHASWTARDPGPSFT